MLHMKECGLSSSSAAGRSCASSSRVEATISLEMEDTSGHFITNEFEDMFQWQSQFCEIDIADHTTIHSMIDELQTDDILQTDNIIASAADPIIPDIDSLQSSTCLTILQVMNSDSTCSAIPMASSETVGMIEMATATKQAAVPAEFVVSNSRPVIAIPASSSDPTSPPPAAANFTSPSVPTPVGSDVRSRREFSVTPDIDVSQCRPNPNLATKPKRIRTARASTPVKKPKVIKEPPVRVNLHPKEVRSPTQADHIIRERQRRDDMSAKYNVLEARLPPAIKRDRAAVVVDAMVLVKNLQHRKTELLKRRSQLQLTTLTRQRPAELPGRIRHDLRNVTGGVNNVPTSIMVRQQSLQEISGSPVSSCMASPALDCIKPVTMDHQVAEAAATRKKTISSDDHSKLDTKSSSTCIKVLHINARHVSDEELVVEMVCSWCQPNFHSLLIQAVESLSLEVIACNICRLPCGLVQCWIAAKPQIPLQKNNEIQLSEKMVGALQSAFHHT